MAECLGKPFEAAVDGEGNAIEFDAAYPLRGRLSAALAELRARHGDDLYLLPISGGSAGGGIFQPRRRPPGSVIGLRFDAPPEPRVSLAAGPALDDVELDEIRIDSEQMSVAAGAAVTLDQLNRALQQELGAGYRVPGADLTSYQYAAVGATFMTGGMGPQRRYFSDSVTAAALHDGEGAVRVDGEALRGYAGTYGWSGIVTALRCRYFRFPANEAAFALPVKNTEDELSRLLAKLAPWCYLEPGADGIVSRAGTEDLIFGIEHVSAAAMQPLLEHGADAAMKSRARGLIEKCRAAAADGLIFVNAASHRFVDEFLIDLADDPDSDEPCIAGLPLEHAEVFADAEEMRLLREAVPYAARMQQPARRFVYKNHTDANVRLRADAVADGVARLWRANREYAAAVDRHFADTDGIDGALLVYGHLNPYGFDPHNRVTLFSDDEDLFQRSREFLVEARARYYRDLAGLCDGASAEFIGGEKTADSEIAIFRALGGPERAPPALGKRFERQRAAIAAAAPMFNWRAPRPYA